MVSRSRRTIRSRLMVSRSRRTVRSWFIFRSRRTIGSRLMVVGCLGRIGGRVSSIGVGGIRLRGRVGLRGVGGRGVRLWGRVGLRGICSGEVCKLGEPFKPLFDLLAELSELHEVLGAQVPGHEVLGPDQQCRGHQPAGSNYYQRPRHVGLARRARRVYSAGNARLAPPHPNITSKAHGIRNPGSRIARETGQPRVRGILVPALSTTGAAVGNRTASCSAAKREQCRPLPAPLSNA